MEAGKLFHLLLVLALESPMRSHATTLAESHVFTDLVGGSGLDPGGPGSILHRAWSFPSS